MPYRDAVRPGAKPREAIGRQADTRPSRWIRSLLLLPFIAVFGQHGHDSVHPILCGIAFVYWYQALWILIAAGLVYTVYRIEN